MPGPCPIHQAIRLIFLVFRQSIQSASVQLSPLSTRQLGLFLAAWRSAEPAWLVTQLNLSHLGPNTYANSIYEIRLIMTSTYIASGAQ